MKPKNNKPQTDDDALYTSKEDIFNKDYEEQEIDPEDISTTKNNDIQSDIYDLDVPGSELDDDDEIIGNEDEENNFYSLGSDDHNDLDEN